jgi:hypothetical protein
MKGNLQWFLPLLHTLVEERVGERRFPGLSSSLYEPAVASRLFLLLVFTARIVHYGTNAGVKRRICVSWACVTRLEGIA